MRCNRVVVVAVLAAITLSACSSDKKSTTNSTKKGSGPTGSLIVITNLGLQDVVTKLVNAYTKNHSGAKITVDTKATRVAIKASVAHHRSEVIVMSEGWLKTMSKGSSIVSLGQTFAVIAVPAKNPKHVSDINAFASTATLRTAVCGRQTFFGIFSALVLFKAKIKPDPKTVNADCDSKAIQELGKGQLDAALMMRGSGSKVPPKSVKLVAIPDKQNITIKIASLGVGKAPLVAAFQGFLASDGAKGILLRNGYLP